MQEHDDAGSEAGSQDDDKEKHYLGNADLGLTKKAMARKALMKQKPKKEVDHRASKNRKIKYVVHDKILNFMPSRDNSSKVEGREAIVSNLFGRRIEPPSQRKRQFNTEDAVRLI